MLANLNQEQGFPTQWAQNSAIGVATKGILGTGGLYNIVTFRDGLDTGRSIVGLSKDVLAKMQLEV